MSYRLCLLLTCTLCAACLPFDDVSQGDPWKTREEEPVKDAPPVQKEDPEDPPVVRDVPPPESCLREPARHRSVAQVCDAERPAGGALPPFVGDEECTHDDDCAEGDNGRCLNSRFGWYCSYDVCFDDAACGQGVCECEGAFRSDANMCLNEGNCRSDADCGEAGYCSPSFGDCGDYFGVIGYFCHTCEDECVDDTDCADANSYCAYNQSVGAWKCSSGQCDG